MKTAAAIALVLLAAVAPTIAKEEKDAELWVASASNVVGWLETRTEADMKKTIAAFDKTLESLGYFKIAPQLKESEAVLTYRAKDDTKVWVKLKQFSSFTNIKVRCGLIGDDDLSREILKRVYAKL